MRPFLSTLVVLLATSPAYAGHEKTATLAVSVTVTSSCQVTTGIEPLVRCGVGEAPRMALTPIDRIIPGTTSDTQILDIVF